MRNRLKSVVDIQAGYHHQEPVGIDTADQSSDNETVPALMRVVKNGVNGVGQQQWNSNPVKILKGLLIVLLSFLLKV